MKAISQGESVYCGKCRKKTSHRLTLEHGSDFILLEIIRVVEIKRKDHFIWKKNELPISFPTSGISIPGTNQKYQVIATSNHRGSLLGGHWNTKVMTKSKIWYECDDLKSTNFITESPGIRDRSVVLLLLMRESCV